MPGLTQDLELEVNRTVISEKYNMTCTTPIAHLLPGTLCGVEATMTPLLRWSPLRASKAHWDSSLLDFDTAILIVKI